jgi:hypothetical protein
LALETTLFPPTTALFAAVKCGQPPAKAGPAAASIMLAERDKAISFFISFSFKYNKYYPPT